MATSSTPVSHQPLAERQRPRTLGEVSALRMAFESGQPHSCIRWGQSEGNTTIARLMAEAFRFQPPKGADVIRQ